MNKSYAQILGTGVYASVQDNGRKQGRAYGIPPSGGLISEWMRNANEAIGNEATCAVLEFYGQGLCIRFSGDAILGFCGLGLEVLLNGETIVFPKIINIKKGTVIKVVKNSGNWGYLAVRHGWQNEVVLDSMSMMKGVTYYDRLVCGLTIPYTSDDLKNLALISESDHVEQNYTTTFFYTLGPESIKANLTDLILDLTLSNDTTRQAICFNETVRGKFQEIVSSYTPLGTIQVTPAGKVFILSRDGQTTGGYFRLGFIVENDISILHRLPIGTKIKLKPR